jgi:exosortase
MPRRTMGFVAYAALVAITCAPVLAALYRHSMSDETASHLVLMPVLSIGLMLLNRQKLFEAVTTSVIPGLVVAGAGISVLGLSLGQPLTEKSSLVPAVAGIIALWTGGFVLFFGARAARAAVMPLAFLAMTIPIPDPLLQAAVEVLKRGSTEMVSWLFLATGTPYIREEFTFTLPSVSIFVADACSGIRSTIGLVITSLLAAHLFLCTSWKKAVLVFMVLPITLLKNAVRIVTLSLLAIHLDMSFLTGGLHHDGGIMFFLIALAMLAPVLTLLVRSERRSQSRPLSLPPSPLVQRDALLG